MTDAGYFEKSHLEHISETEKRITDIWKMSNIGQYIGQPLVIFKLTQ